jgi:hypothetical protein
MLGRDRGSRPGQVYLRDSENSQSIFGTVDRVAGWAANLGRGTRLVPPNRPLELAPGASSGSFRWRASSSKRRTCRRESPRQTPPFCDASAICDAAPYKNPAPERPPRHRWQMRHSSPRYDLVQQLLPGDDATARPEPRFGASNPVDTSRRPRPAPCPSSRRPITGLAPAAPPPLCGAARAAHNSVEPPGRPNSAKAIRYARAETR